MATRVCPQCNAQYVASVRRCIDCDVMLVDDVGESTGSTSATVEASSGDQLAYELEGWGNQLRQSLAGMLDRSGVPFVWEAGTLVVPAAFEEQVDSCIAAVEGEEAEEAPDDVPLVAFDIEGALPEELDELDARLIADHIPHSWEEAGALVVAADREDEVAELIAAVLDGGDDEDLDGGLAIHEALEALFLAVDKVARDPGEERAATRYLAASAAVGGAGVPYGLAGEDWRALLAEVAELDVAVITVHPRLGPDDADDDGGDEGDGDEGADGADDDGVGEDATRSDAGDGDGEHADSEDGGDGEDAGDGDAADEDADLGDQPEVTPQEAAAQRARDLRERLRDLV